MVSSIVNENTDNGKLYAIIFYNKLKSVSERESVCCMMACVSPSVLIDNGWEPIRNEDRVVFLL